VNIASVQMQKDDFKEFNCRSLKDNQSLFSRRVEFNIISTYKKPN